MDYVLREHSALALPNSIAFAGDLAQSMIFDLPLSSIFGPAVCIC